MSYFGSPVSICIDGNYFRVERLHYKHRLRLFWSGFFLVNDYAGRQFKWCGNHQGDDLRHNDVYAHGEWRGPSAEEVAQRAYNGNEQAGERVADGADFLVKEHGE